MTAHILLDISRLLSRAGRPAPSGIERVELAYAHHLAATLPERLSYAAMTAWGRFGPLPAKPAAAFVEALAARWDGAMAAGPRDRASRIAERLNLRLVLRGEAALHGGLRRLAEPVVYLLVSHHHLDRPAVLARLKAQTGARIVCLVHDLIPITHPEYARPGHDRRHRRRMATVARLADGVIVNSAATGEAFTPFLAEAGRAPPLLVAPLGVALPPLDMALPPGRPEAAGPAEPPYFVCLGTIEPRKNHLLLLNLWRRLAEKGEPPAPRLVLIGRRGWENENVVDMIERCRAIHGLVEEHNALSDGALLRLLRGARALLLPSFVEGYGLPVAEALALGVPVLCSDLAALREVGGAVPEYLDPLDGPAWGRAIRDYALAHSAARGAQLARLALWRPPSWADHFAAVTELVERVAAQPALA